MNESNTNKSVEKVPDPNTNKRVKYDVDKILDDVFNKGLSRKKVCELYGVSPGYLSKLITTNKKAMTESKKEGTLQKEDTKEKSPLSPKTVNESEDSKSNKEESESEETGESEQNKSNIKSNKEQSNESEYTTEEEVSGDDEPDELTKKLNGGLTPHKEDIKNSASPDRDGKSGSPHKEGLPSQKKVLKKSTTEENRVLNESIKQYESTINALKEKLREQSEQPVNTKPVNVHINPLPDDSVEKDRHKQLILIIRNYVLHFGHKLHDLLSEYGSNKNLFKKLHNMSNNELEALLESIRIELCVSKGHDVFNKMFVAGVFALETSSSAVGVDLTGLTGYVQSDAGFSDTLKQTACEYAINTSPRTDLLIKLGYAISTTYNINCQKQEIEKKQSDLNSIISKHEIEKKQSDLNSIISKHEKTELNTTVSKQI